jgi:hypothetical protein
VLVSYYSKPLNMMTETLAQVSHYFCLDILFGDMILKTEPFKLAVTGCALLLSKSSLLPS